MQSSTKAFFTDCAFDPVRGAIVMTGHNGDVLRSAGRRTKLGRRRNRARRPQEFSERDPFRRAQRLAARHRPGRHTCALHRRRRAVDPRVGRRARRCARPDQRHDAKSPHRVRHGRHGAELDGFRSARWTDDRGALDFSLREIEPTPRGDALIATSKLGDIIRSADGGASWRSLPVTYPNPNTPPDLRGLIVAPSGEALIAVGPPGAILRSNADGTAWDVRHSTPIEAERAFPWVLVDQRRKILVAVEARGAMQVSRDDGVSWQVSSIPIPQEAISDLARHGARSAVA